MKTYIQSLRDYIKENKIAFEFDSPQPCLDALWWHYGEHYNLDNAETKASFEKIWTMLNSLPFLESDAIMSEFDRLCAEYERTAFTAGLCVGAQLMIELCR